MIENPTKRQEIDGDYERPSKRLRMSVDPAEEKPTLELQDDSLLDNHTDTDEAEFQPTQVTRASDLYLDTVCLVISII